MKKVIKQIELNKSGDYVNIYFLGDFHFGSLMFYEELFLKIREKIKQDKHALVLCMGDTFELDSSKMRQRLITANLDRFHNYIENNKPHLDRIDNEILPLLDFLNYDNCIGMLDGNHYRLFFEKEKINNIIRNLEDKRDIETLSNILSSVKVFGFTDTQYICTKKKITYLGDGEANIYLKIRLNNTKRLIAIKAYHSHANGMSEVFDMNKLINKAKALEGFDIIVKAHTHRPLTIPFKKEVANQYNDDGYDLKDVWLINTSSTRKYRKIDVTDYSEKSNYNPTSYAIPCLTIRMQKTRTVRGYSNNELYIDGHLLTLI